MDVRDKLRREKTRDKVSEMRNAKIFRKKVKTESGVDGVRRSWRSSPAAVAGDGGEVRTAWGLSL